jgi:acetoin utilization deacetylase AcuC-like enzyme
MTLLYFSRQFADHDTQSHPEAPRRIAAIEKALEQANLFALCTQPTWQPASPTQLARVHSPDYLQQLQTFASQGGGWIEQDTILSPASYSVATSAAGAACDAVTRVLAGEAANALCILRPPGHHALPNHAMGFCLINHVAVAALEACQTHQVDRVLIIDWDVHHGNGTQDVFWDKEHVGFFSIHRWPFYPGSGSREETGTGPGLGTTCNVPIPYGTPPREFLHQFQQGIEQLAKKIQPDLILLSAGFDAHRDDPIGSLDLDEQHFAEMTDFVKEIAAQYCQGRIVSLLEGGYNPQALGRSVVAHLQHLLPAFNHCRV